MAASFFLCGLTIGARQHNARARGRPDLDKRPPEGQAEVGGAISPFSSRRRATLRKEPHTHTQLTLALASRACQSACDRNNQPAAGHSAANCPTQLAAQQFDEAGACERWQTIKQVAARWQRPERERERDEIHICTCKLALIAFVYLVAVEGELHVCGARPSRWPLLERAERSQRRLGALPSLSRQSVRKNKKSTSLFVGTNRPLPLPSAARVVPPPPAAFALVSHTIKEGQKIEELILSRAAAAAGGQIVPCKGLAAAAAARVGGRRSAKVANLTLQR